MEATAEVVTLNGVRYIREDSVPEPPTKGKRAVIVVDWGWIFAGDVEEDEGDLKKPIILRRAVHVRKWSEIGFDGMIADPKSPKVDLRKLTRDPEIPARSVIFRVPVPSDWGL